jgi:hypothetical protein
VVEDHAERPEAEEEVELEEQRGRHPGRLPPRRARETRAERREREDGEEPVLDPEVKREPRNARRHALTSS